MKKNNQPAVPNSKKAKKKSVKGFNWEEWGKDATRLFGEVYRGEHEGKTIVSIFRCLDLSYNKYSEGSWNRHYNDIKNRVLQYKTNVMGLKNDTLHKFVFGVAASQSQPRNPDSATVIAPPITAARKRAIELKSEDTLGSSDSTLSSDDKTFLPDKLEGGVTAFYEEYSFDGNKSELSSLRSNIKIYGSPFLERRYNKEPEAPSPTKVLFKYPPAQILGH
jgi:hypothetical protein